MNIQDLISVHKRQKQLQTQRENKIKNRLLAKKRDQLADGSQKKASKIKTKKIQKVKISTIQQRVNKPKVQLQNNVSVTTFLNESKDYKKYYERTKNAIKLDKQNILKHISMLKTVCQQSKKNSSLLSIEVKFDQPVNPPVRPFQLKLPFRKRINNIIIICDDLNKLKQNIKNWKQPSNIELYTLREFRTNLKDSKFHQKALNSSTLLFCDFKIFQQLSDSPFYQQVSTKNAIFPIECKKVPYNTQTPYANYQEFIQSLCQYSYFLVRPGKQFIIHIGDLIYLSPEENLQNLVEGLITIVARLLCKNKTKGGKVEKISLKTTFSIPIEVYNPN